MMLRRRQRAELLRLDRGRLRIAIVAETFLPVVNGVTNSVLRVIEHLRAEGHDVLVIAPGPGEDMYEDVPVVRLRSFDVPRYDDLSIAVPRRLSAVLRDFAPDVVHLAAPTVLGAAAGRVAARLSIPVVAIFQTDIAGFAKRQRLGMLSRPIWAYLRWVHESADLTLAPSRASVWTLNARGFRRVERWARGVDLERFHPDHRCEDLRRFLAPNGEMIVGYVGRLAKEKQVERLAPISARPDVRVVVVGDGPERAQLERKMPTARFVGFQGGAELSRLHASFDAFVHTGIDETFCQALQESMASGVPSIAPSAGGPLDLVQQGITGCFWSPESPETLDGAVLDLAAHEALRKQMGAAARAEAAQRPWSVIMDELVEHYRRVGQLPYAAKRQAA